jgi:hypothetical protein
MLCLMWKKVEHVVNNAVFERFSACKRIKMFWGIRRVQITGLEIYLKQTAGFCLQYRYVSIKYE